MIDPGGSKILLDTGPGSLRQMLQAGIKIDDIDYIVYSHFHIDHTADMIPFIFASKYSPGSQRTKDLSIIGPTGLQEFYRHLLVAYGKLVVPEHFTIHWIEAGKTPGNFQSFVLKTAPTKHTENSIAIRIEDKNKNSVVYSGDSEYCKSLVTLAQKASLLILECAFPEHMQSTGHLIPSVAGKIARESHCKKLLLTHFYPLCEEFDLLAPLRAEFSGEVVLAEDLMNFSVG